MSLFIPSRRLLVLFLIAAILVIPAFSMPARGAEPGAAILSFNGTLDASVPVRSVPLSESGPANLRLAVSGGSSSDTVTLTLLDGGATALQSWVARSGETIWGFASLPPGASLRVQTSGAALNFQLSAYARGTVLAPSADAASWAGVAVGAGAQTGVSDGQFVVPVSGRYQISLGAASGAYQLVIDGSYLRKTVVSGSAPAAADSTYYLAAGNHHFQIIPDSGMGVTTSWSLQLATDGAIDSLPYEESAAALGGGTGSGTFVEEWVPIRSAAAHSVNIRIAATGAASDSFQVELYNGDTKVLSSGDIAGGEVVWVTSALTAGANALHIVARPGNSAPIGYSLSVSELFAPGLSWSGTSLGASATRSTARASFAQAGLYTFTLGATSGRYQLRLDDNYLRKVVTTTGVTFSAYVAAGVHTLTVVQQGTGTTAWSVAIEAVDATDDTLPFTRSGSLLGGAGNDFQDESLPIQVAAAGPVNIRVAASDGSANDALRVEIFSAGGATPSFSAASVFTGEVLWATSSLTSGVNLLRVSAAEGNSAPMSYQVEISSVAVIPLSWSGVARGGGLNSTIVLNAPEDGTYNVALTLDSGNGQVIIGGAAAASQLPSLESTSLTLRVPLKAGPHRFSFVQDGAQATTSWTISTSLLQKAVPLGVTSLTPGLLALDVGGEITLNGTGFESGTAVVLLNSSGEPVAASAVTVSSTQIVLTIPANTPVGVYSLRLTNANGETVNMPGALSVGQLHIYLPLIWR